MSIYPPLGREHSTGRLRRKSAAGIFLALLGLSLVSMALVSVTSAEEVTNLSFTVGPGGRYGPYDNGTAYHTRVLGKSVLQGEITVAGEGIYFTANGYNTQQIKDLYIMDAYGFVIDPADDLYTFTFNNTTGHNESSLTFKLKEIWTRSIVFGSHPLFIAWLTGFLVLPAGIAIVAATSSKFQSAGPRTKDGNYLILEFFCIRLFFDSFGFKSR